MLFTQSDLTRTAIQTAILCSTESHFQRPKLLLQATISGVAPAANKLCGHSPISVFQCIIAPAFGEIFHANCFKNGVLPIVLDPAAVERLRERAEQAEQFTVNLQDQLISVGGKAAQKFSIQPHRREVLLKGWDDIDLILNNDSDAINEFEQRQRGAAPWLYSD